MIKCIERLKRVAEAAGASVDESMLEAGSLVLDAPAGYVWSASREPTMVEAGAVRGTTWWAQACRDMEQRMAQGLDKCDAEQSAAIEYDRDEPWTAPTGAPDHVAVG